MLWKMSKTAQNTVSKATPKPINNQSQIYQRANNTINAWPAWKKEAYNTSAVSAHAKQVPIPTNE